MRIKVRSGYLVLLVGAAVMLWPARVQAQTGALTAITIQYFQNGAILPAQVQTIPLPAGATCGQAVLPGSPPAVTYINTTGRIVWTDPANTTLNCVAVQAAGSVLLALPLGANYTATGFFTNDFGGASQPSPPSNSFTRGAPPTPPAPTGVQVRP